jgi:phospholipid-binding lipoprotein MlaA
MALGGCAAQEVQFHRWPAETPAAKLAANIVRAEELRAEAARDAMAAAKSGGETPEEPPLVTPADAPPMNTYDPWGRVNRLTYRFNARIDEALFLPLANGYRRLLPSPMRAAVHNFFGNLSEVNSVANYTLQGRFGRGVRSVGRFVINSTLGIGGLFDIAEKWGLARAPTGFGTTLARWGMHPGPYLVIPLLGPSTLRGAMGSAGDYGTLYGINLANLYRSGQSWDLGVVNTVDQRSSVDFRYYSTGSPFEYETVRFLVVRKQLIEDAGLHRKDAVRKRDPNTPAGE